VPAAMDDPVGERAARAVQPAHDLPLHLRLSLTKGKDDGGDEEVSELRQGDA
jgi:hypothetical protein